MSKNETCIYTLYFNETNNYVQQYGKNTIVLMQVGGFFEMYGYKEGDQINGSCIDDVCNYCGFSISEKKSLFKNCPLVMAGVPEYSIDKHIPLIMESGYTVVVFKQVDIEGSDKKKRVLENIYSPGTFIPQEETRILSNNIVCIWLELNTKLVNVNNKSRYSLQYGASCVDMVSGYSIMIQHSYNIENKKLLPSYFDELQRFISVYNPNETIIISTEDDSTIRSIIDMNNVHSRLVHILDPKDNKKVVKCEKQVYQKEVIQQYFNVNTYDICEEFRINMLATQSYCYLLNFIKEHNPNLVKHIQLPDFNTSSERVVLANHTLSQLNIIDDNNIQSKSYGKKSSVSNFLNHCCSAMGKREFRLQMTNPTTNVKWLQREYIMIQHMLDNYSQDERMKIRQHLSKIKDIQRIVRQIMVRKLPPTMMYQLYTNIKEVLLCIDILKEDIVLLNYIWNRNEDANEETILDEIVNIFIQEKTYLESVLNIENCAFVSVMKSCIETPIIRTNNDEQYDTVFDAYNGYEKTFVEIKDYLEERIQECESKVNGSGYIKIHKTDKSGKYLEITAPRSTKLKEALQTYEGKNKNTAKPVLLKDIKFVTGNGKNKKIESQDINNVVRSILEYEGKVQKESLRVYDNIMKEIETAHVENLDRISLFITKLDVIQSKTYVADQYNYCMPVLEEHTQSFVHAYDLRHVLIEHIQQDETYVPNNMFLNKPIPGNDEDSYECGNLLYGTNAVGKTSLIRALGICVIMAQCGMYVPCSKLVFKPYTGIYSRIIGNDNLFRGLSTFAVEMSELRVILKEANQNSLILGDELCSGTELQSALSIFVSGLEKMYHKKSSFIFATHFHEIVHYDEIKSMKHLGIKHMEVIYNRELDELIYDRKIKEGPGTNTYGLEVCKSLHLEQDFLTRAYDIRDKYFKEFAGTLTRGTSRYNAKKILGVCEMCNNEMGTEVHHIEHQKDANEKGYVGSVHKNHKANLMNICEECHDELHRNENKHIKKKKTLTGKVVLN